MFVGRLRFAGEGVILGQGEPGNDLGMEARSISEFCLRSANTTFFQGLCFRTPLNCLASLVNKTLVANQNPIHLHIRFLETCFHIWLEPGCVRSRMNVILKTLARGETCAMHVVMEQDRNCRRQ